jgi:hypothetical protein
MILVLSKTAPEFIRTTKLQDLLRFFYKPITLSVLGVALAILSYIATTQDVLEEGRDKRRV